MFPIAPAFYPIWFAQSSTSLYINYNPKIMLASILQPEVHRLGAAPNLPRKLLMGKSIWLLFKERKSCVHTHDLTNMNHTIPKLYDVSGISLG
jgi:hypothetical protein